MGSVIEEMNTPPTDGPAPDDELFIRLRGWIKKGREHWAEWRKEAIECYRFRDGDHWDEKAKEEMLASGRQPVVFNRAGVIIDAVSGMEVNNRQEVIYKPRTQGDVAKNEMASGAAQWARDEAQADDEESDAFVDVLTCGIGCTETRMDYSDGDAAIAIDRIDPLEVGIDPASKKRNAVDRRYSWRVRSIPADVARTMYPAAELAALNATWAAQIDTRDGGEGNKDDYPEETRAALRSEADPKEVTLVDIEWYDTVTETVVAVEGAADVEIVPQDQWATAQARLDELGVPYQTARQQRRVYYYAVLGAAGVIEKVERECFQREFITGKRDRNKKCWYGLVRAMRDPQMLANKVLAQILHILNSNAKGGLMYESDAFENVRDAEKDWSNPQKSIRLTPGALAGNKIQERKPPPMPDVLSRLLEYAVSSIKDVTGVSVELLGLADRDQPASLEFQRRQSATTILAHFFDSLRRYRKNQGLVLLKLLRKLTPGTLMRVTLDVNGQQVEQNVPFDPARFDLADETIRYDVIVDEAPSAPNQKDQVWAFAEAMMERTELPPSIMAELLDYSPLPQSVAQKIKALILAEQAQQQAMAAGMVPGLPAPVDPMAPPPGMPPIPMEQM